MRDIFKAMEGFIIMFPMPIIVVTREIGAYLE
jgi:hypothetical protein